MNPIGIMQGRLSPAGARPQSFPRETWRDEFDRARRCGFDCLEWLITESGLEENPIWARPDDIRRCAEDSGVRLTTLCADCFLQRGDDHALLERLLAAAAGLGIDTVVVPWLEQNAVGVGGYRRRLSALRPMAARHRVRIAIESDLAAAAVRELIAECAPFPIGVCYDTGNAAAIGDDAAADLRTLGWRVFAIHIKDRTRSGPSVPLGHGSVNFARLADALIDIDYRGALVLETPRGADPMIAARTQREFLEQRLRQAVAAVRP